MITEIPQFIITPQINFKYSKRLELSYPIAVVLALSNKERTCITSPLAI